MGYYTRDGGIRCYRPDDGDTWFYIGGDSSLQEITEAACARFKIGQEEAMKRILIEAEYIHVDCLGYDHYDPSDYRQYLKITLSDTE